MHILSIKDKFSNLGEPLWLMGKVRDKGSPALVNLKNSNMLTRLKIGLIHKICKHYN